MRHCGERSLPELMILAHARVRAWVACSFLRKAGPGRRDALYPSRRGRLGLQKAIDHDEVGPGPSRRWGVKDSFRAKLSGQECQKCGSVGNLVQGVDGGRSVEPRLAGGCRHVSQCKSIPIHTGCAVSSPSWSKKEHIDVLAFHSRLQRTRGKGYRPEERNGK